MKGQKPIKAIKEESWFQQAPRRASRQIKAHPIAYTIRFVILSGFIYLICDQLLARGHASPILIIGALIFAAVQVARLTRELPKGDQVHEWALTEQEHITMMSLTGKTVEELEKLLEYHMKYGNIEEADRISQKLLTMVDKGYAPLDDANAAPSTQTKKEGLPEWMEGEGDSQQSGEQIEDPKKKLPDWME